MWQQLVQQGLKQFHERNFEEAEKLLAQAVTEMEAAGAGPQEIAEPLLHLSGSQRAQRKFAQALEGMSRLLQIYRQLYGPNDPKVGSVMHELAQLSGLLGRTSDAEQAFLETFRIVHAGGDPLQIAEYLTTLAAFYGSHGGYQHALDRFQETLELRTKHQGADHDEVIETYLGMATMLEGLNRWDEAEQKRLQAQELLAKKYAAQHSHVAAVIFARGMARRMQSKWEEARVLFEEALAIRKQAGEGAEVGKTQQEIAYALMMMPRLDEAEKVQRETLETFTAAKGENDPETALALGSLARIWQLQGRLDEAEGAYQQALDTLRQGLGDDHPFVLQMSDNLVEIAIQRKDFATAEKLATEHLKYRSQRFGPDHHSVAEALNRLGTVWLHQKDYLKASSAFEQALGIWERYPGAADFQRTLCYYNMGAACHGKVDWFRAEEFYRKALNELERNFGENHPSIPHVLTNLATLLKQTGREKQAQEMQERAKNF